MLKTIVVAAAFAGLLANTAVGEEASRIVSYTVEGTSYDDVLIDVENAVINRGLVADLVSHVGDMLDRTAADVGATKKIFVGASVTQFCSAVLSRNAMEADPGNIAFCPYGVFVYATADAPTTVHVGYRRLMADAPSEASQTAIDAVNGLLDEVAREAAGM